MDSISNRFVVQINLQHFTVHSYKKKIDNTQVLSIIKIKQPAVPGISPLLIRKVSRGVRPVSTLFEHINSQYARTYRNLSRRKSRSQQRIIGSYVSCEQLMRASSSLANHQAASSYKQNAVTCEPLYEEDEVYLFIYLFFYASVSFTVESYVKYCIF